EASTGCSARRIFPARTSSRDSLLNSDRVPGIVVLHSKSDSRPQQRQPDRQRVPGSIAREGGRLGSEPLRPGVDGWDERLRQSEANGPWSARVGEGELLL